MNRRTVMFAGTAAAAIGAWRLSRRDTVLSDATADGAAPKISRANTALGINLTPISYWTPVAFIDRLKASSPWDTHGVRAPLNPRGYPTGLNGQRFISTMMPCEEGTYVLLHDGDMDVRLQGGTLVARRGDETSYEVRGPMPAGRQLIIDAMRRPPTFMHLLRQRDLTAFRTGEIFAPEFLAQVNGFNTLRFMDWMRTNGSDITEAFPPVDACSYAACVPLEVMLRLARMVGAHPWLCIPHLASDTLVAATLAVLRKAAKQGPAPYVEYSNEVWNLGFPQARYAQQQSVSRWGSDSPAAVFYGYRTGQIAVMARGSGCRVVIGSQTLVPARADQVWDGVRRSGAMNGDFEGWIIATYVAGTLTEQRGPTLELATRHDVTGAIDNLLNATGIGAMSVATMSPIYEQQGSIAAAHGLKLLAYEGNMHLNPLPAFGAQKALARPFFEAITQSPLAAQVTESNLRAFESAGGSLACLYNLSSEASDGGVFGLVQSGSWDLIQKRLAH